MGKSEPLKSFAVKLMSGEIITFQAHGVQVNGSGVVISFFVCDGKKHRGNGWMFPLCNVLYVSTAKISEAQT